MQNTSACQAVIILAYFKFIPYYRWTSLNVYMYATNDLERAAANFHYKNNTVVSSLTEVQLTEVYVHFFLKVIIDKKIFTDMTASQNKKRKKLLTPLATILSCGYLFCVFCRVQCLCLQPPVPQKCAFDWHISQIKANAKARTLCVFFCCCCCFVSVVAIWGFRLFFCMILHGLSASSCCCCCCIVQQVSVSFGIWQNVCRYPLTRLTAQWHAKRGCLPCLLSGCRED